MLQKKSKLEDRPLELTQLEQQNKKKDRNNEESLRDLWDNIKCTITLQGSKEKRERDSIMNNIANRNVDDKDVETTLLLARNKWVISHPDRKPLIDQGAYPGIIGENKELYY